ncbi:hypothetical protein KM043_004348 [Ampulex compressa]|nr:hypothetical protein KM043_004348 [Ampulex compressa]
MDEKSRSPVHPERHLVIYAFAGGMKRAAKVEDAEGGTTRVRQCRKDVTSSRESSRLGLGKKWPLSLDSASMEEDVSTVIYAALLSIPPQERRHISRDHPARTFQASTRGGNDVRAIGREGFQALTILERSICTPKRCRSRLETVGGRPFRFTAVLRILSWESHKRRSSRADAKTATVARVVTRSYYYPDAGSINSTADTGGHGSSKIGIRLPASIPVENDTRSRASLPSRQCNYEGLRAARFEERRSDDGLEPLVPRETSRVKNYLWIISGLECSVKGGLTTCCFQNIPETCLIAPMGLADKLLDPPRKCCARYPAPIASSTINQSKQHPSEASYRSTLKRYEENCHLAKCKHVKGETERQTRATSESLNVQRLIGKIQDLKKNIQNLEAAQQHLKSQGSEKKGTYSQTSEVPIADLNEARRALEVCLQEISKVKKFLDDENCWWKMLKDRETACCSQKLPHLHGFLDGTPVTLKLLEEAPSQFLDKFKTSTPLGSPRRIHSDPASLSSVAAKHVEQYTDPWNHDAEYIDASTVPCKSLEFSGANALLEKQCPLKCTNDKRDLEIPGSSKVSRHEREEDLSGGSTIFKDPPGWKELQGAKKKENLTGGILSGKLWHKKNSQENLERRSASKKTFANEDNTSKKRTVAEVGTSVDLNSGIPYKTTSVSTKSYALKTTLDRSFPQSTEKISTKSRYKSKEQSTQPATSTKYSRNWKKKWKRQSKDKNEDVEMDKIITIARCPAPAAEGNLKMGTKTILTLRERAIMRSPLPTPSTSSQNTSSTQS